MGVFGYAGGLKLATCPAKLKTFRGIRRRPIPDFQGSRRDHPTGALHNDRCQAQCRQHQPQWRAEFDAARARPFELHMKYAFIHTYKPVLDDEPYRSFETTEDYGDGATGTCPNGWVMGPISYNQVEELRDALDRHQVTYLFIGKTGAILHGFPDTTQDADLFVRKTSANGRALTRALRELGFAITEDQARDIERGKDFVQLKNGPFDVDLVFAPDGIERFEDAWQRGSNVAGFPVCSIGDIIASKKASNRPKDREALPRLEDFQRYLQERGTPHAYRLPRLPDEKHRDKQRYGYSR